MSIKIRKHSRTDNIYFVNEKQVVIDDNNNAVSIDKLTE